MLGSKETLHHTSKTDVILRRLTQDLNCLRWQSSNTKKGIRHKLNISRVSDNWVICVIVSNPMLSKLTKFPTETKTVDIRTFTCHLLLKSTGLVATWANPYLADRITPREVRDISRDVNRKIRPRQAQTSSTKTLERCPAREKVELVMMATDKAKNRGNRSIANRITIRSLTLEMVVIPGSPALSTKRHNIHMTDTLMSQWQLTQELQVEIPIDAATLRQLLSPWLDSTC